MAIGVIRKIDNMGRVTIPTEFRKYLNLSKGESVEIVLKEEGIKIKKIKKGDK